ncbi:MAG: hypothetical protein COC19_02925 [SAR86 cluster bacterium]|uniref:Uncharacterized protein n=1 Tax=SAR86 cluster bacterium TaxID=2030880 RepID=A0A2A4MRN2_9GAMM|nr:MAG: hypothetical protein COC19_02925 [SAR86 cluster bacterium]
MDREALKKISSNLYVFVLSLLVSYSSAVFSAENQEVTGEEKDVVILHFEDLSVFRRIGQAWSVTKNDCSIVGTVHILENWACISAEIRHKITQEAHDVVFINKESLWQYRNHMSYKYNVFEGVTVKSVQLELSDNDHYKLLEILGLSTYSKMRNLVQR